VIMPAYNSAKTLSIAIRSTLKALRKNDELLVGLHNCTDDSKRVASSFSYDNRLSIHEVSGGGVAKVLNKLIELSRYDLIARVDSDDACLPWKFRVQVKQMAKHDVDFLFSTAIIGWKAGPVKLWVPQHLTSLSNSQVHSLLRAMTPLVQPTMLAKKSALNANGGYVDVAGEDLDLWLRAAVGGFTFFRSALPTLIYNLSPNQLSKQDWYLKGWKTSESVAANRAILAMRTKNHVLGWREKLEIIGPVLPQNFGRLRDFKNEVLQLDKPESKTDI
jgi:glycosyltransferase involved in cell wall biosynthesis